MSKNQVRKDSARSKLRRQRSFLPRAEQLEVRSLLAADVVVPADLLEGELTLAIAVDQSALIYAAGSTAANSGTFMGADTISASVGTVIDNGDGTWSWSLENVQLGDSQTVTITAENSLGTTSAATFELDVRSGDFPLLSDIVPGDGDNVISKFVRIGDVVYFGQTATSSPDGLWKTDGTPGGTELVSPVTVDGDNLIALNGLLYFLRIDPTDGSRDLWQSDGTDVGTMPTFEFSTVDPDNAEVTLTAVDNLLYFNVDDGVHGQELWVSDGTAAGTRLVADIAAGATSAGITSITSADHYLYFVADDGVNGPEIWRTDGTLAGATQMTDLYYLFGSSLPPRHLTAVGDDLYFNGPDRAIWKIDGATGITDSVKYASATGDKPILGQNLASVDGQLYFTFSGQIWTTDGTTLGTVPLFDASFASGATIWITHKVGDDFYIAEDVFRTSESDKLWKYDQTTGDATLLATFPFGTFDDKLLTEIDGAFYFRGYDAQFGYQLWRTDGTPDGTTRASQFVTSTDSPLPAPIAGPGSTLIVSNETDQFGREAYSVSLDTPPVIQFQPMRLGADGQSVDFSAVGTFDFQDAVSELQFAWDLDGDGLYDDASELQINVSFAALAASGVSAVSLRVIDTDGQIATQAYEFDPRAPLVTVEDAARIVVKEGLTAVNGGRFAHILGGNVQLSASVGAVFDNGDGTWSWSYATQDGPDDSQTVIITASDEDHQASASFTLIVNNVTPTFTIDTPTVTVKRGEIAINSGTYHDVPADTVNGGATFGSVVVNDDGTWAWSVDSTLANVGNRYVYIRMGDETADAPYASFILKVETAILAADVDQSSISYVAGSTAFNSGTIDNPNNVPIALTASVGTVVDNGDGTWSWTLGDAQVSDSQTVTITADDEHGAVSETSFTLTVVPQPQAELIKDLGPSNSWPQNFIRVSDYVYFFAYDENDVAGFWRTDGTAEGTVFLKATGLASGVQGDDWIVNVDGIIFFHTYQDGTATLWKSDGTSDGTVPLIQLDSIFADLTAFNGRAYFTADDGVHGKEIWTSDGTVEGTRLWFDATPGAGSSVPIQLTVSNGLLFFAAGDGLHDGHQLWSSDGTLEGTTRLSVAIGGYSFSALQDAGGTLYFSADDGTLGYELWKSDGTVDGTTLVVDLIEGSDSPNLTNFAALDGTLYFRAQLPGEDYQLWKIDDATGLPVQVSDFSFPEDNDVVPLVRFAGEVYFALTKLDQRPELWKLNETSGETQWVATLQETYPFQTDDGPAVINGKLFFRGYDEVNDSQIWMTDGTSDGTVRVTNLESRDEFGDFIPFDDLLVFSGTDINNGYQEPYRLNLTAGPAANIANPTFDFDTQSVLVTAFQSFDLLDSTADLQFDWDLDGDGRYNDATGFRLSLPLAEWNLPALWEIGLRVTNSRGVSATDSLVIDTQTPYLTVDNVTRTINLTESTSNNGRFGDFLGEPLTLSATLGDVVDNGDGTWTWNYTAPSTGPSTNMVVKITADDGAYQGEVSFQLAVNNPGPTLTVDQQYLYVQEGTVATTTGTYADASAAVVSLTSTVGEMTDHGDGTWTWTFLVPSDYNRDSVIWLFADDADGGRGFTILSLRTMPAAAAFITINDAPAVTDEQGEVTLLPVDLETITEWDGLTLNLWMRRDELYIDQMHNVAMNLHFDDARYALESYEKSVGVGQLAVNNVGDALEITASGFSHGDDDLGELMLLGSFRFRPASNSGVANDADGGYPELQDLGFSLSDVETTTERFGVITGSQVGAPATQLQVVPYDLDDDGVIGLIDLTYLIRKLGSGVAASPELYPYDFDRDGVVSLIDLTYLIRNIGVTAESGEVQFPNIVPPAPLESEAIVATTSSSSLLEGESFAPIPASPLRDESQHADIDAAFGNLSLLEPCLETPVADETEQGSVEQAIVLDDSPWQPTELPDWALQASTIVDCVMEKAISVLEELEEEHPRIGLALDRLKSRFEDL